MTSKVEKFNKNEKRAQRPDPVLILDNNKITLYDNFKRQDNGNLSYKKKQFKVVKKTKKGYPKHWLYIHDFIVQLRRVNNKLQYKLIQNTGAREPYAVDPYKPKKKHHNDDGKDYSKIRKSHWVKADTKVRFGNYKTKVLELEKFDSKWGSSVFTNWKHLKKGTGYYRFERYGAESGLQKRTWLGQCKAKGCYPPPSSLVQLKTGYVIINHYWYNKDGNFDATEKWYAINPSKRDNRYMGVPKPVLVPGEGEDPWVYFEFKRVGRQLHHRTTHYPPKEARKFKKELEANEEKEAQNAAKAAEDSKKKAIAESNAKAKAWHDPRLSPFGQHFKNRDTYNRIRSGNQIEVIREVFEGKKAKRTE